MKGRRLCPLTALALSTWSDCAASFSTGPSLGRRTPLSHVRFASPPQATAGAPVAASAAGGQGDQELKELREFVGWATANLGAKLPKATAGVVAGLRGVVASEAVAPNEEIISVPSRAALITTTDQTLPRSLRRQVDRDFWAQNRWFVRLALLLLAERDKGDASDLKPWIDVLPKSFDTPLHWEEKELESLGYPAMVERVLEQRSSWDDIYAKLMESSPDCPWSKEDLVWGMEIAYSRAFSGPYEGRSAASRQAEVIFVCVLAGLYLGAGLGTIDQAGVGLASVLVSIPLRDFFTSKLVELKRYALTPVIDLVNHKSGVTSDVSYNYFYDYFAITTQEGWAPGQQVFISYGDRSNDHLLQHYGFVEEGNTNDVYDLVGLPSKVSDLLGASIDSERLSLFLKSPLSTKCERVKLQRSTDQARPAPPPSKRERRPIEDLSPKQAEARMAADALLLRRGSLPDALAALRLVVLEDGQLSEERMSSVKMQDFQSQLSVANERAATLALIKILEAEQQQLVVQQSPRTLAEALLQEKRAVLSEVIGRLQAKAKALGV